MKMQTSALTLAVACALSACATGPDRKPGDPLEPMNRAVFKFNDSLDTYVAQPIAKGYQKVTPSPLRTAISNFFSNLGDLDNAANNLLQLNITDATQDIMRFAFNSTFGLFGLLDWATPAGLPKHHQDFGLTLGYWGVPTGPYLVLPLFGPSSFRDSLSLAVDYRLNPLSYAEPAVRNPMYLLQFVSKRADLLGATDLLSQAALDKYSFVRDAYTQQRISLLRAAGAVGTSPNALPDYGEPDDSGAAPPSGASGAAPGGVPDYSDPGEGAQGPATPAPASGTQPNAPSDAPNYTDPGEAPASGASGSTPPADSKVPEIAPLPKPNAQ
ncbi:MlaA family lipoprotein [Paraburkholderia saeva]|uniref:ABC transporter n=1 Tax=Paraburkholderia saeva TaxID=2777537 RepID=A0A9N8S1J7_9BURK|nr:VacJ family lipoprotein [Paraburkholderia saeva]CAG4914597.1 hypothetical protein R52603_04255 [Paraburkholderia saeva]CAG4918135.1 hypothetical protein R70241_04613 [Paraburkholderia saeva]CAG4922809.1 hypothetical protein LMG31841_05226 [Paraburkholderia saeva]